MRHRPLSRARSRPTDAAARLHEGSRAHAAGLDLPAISAEAAVVLEKWPSGNRDVINVWFAPLPSPPRRSTVSASTTATKTS